MGTTVNRVANITANTTVVIPAGCAIISAIVENTTANTVTGGVKVGTTNGGTEVIVALAVGASALLAVPDATILKSVFSMSVDTTLYIQTVTLWNSASLNISFVLRKLIL